MKVVHKRSLINQILGNLADRYGLVDDNGKELARTTFSSIKLIDMNGVNAVEFCWYERGVFCSKVLKKSQVRDIAPIKSFKDLGVGYDRIDDLRDFTILVRDGGVAEVYRDGEKCGVIHLGKKYTIDDECISSTNDVNYKTALVPNGAVLELITMIDSKLNFIDPYRYVRQDIDDLCNEEFLEKNDRFMRLLIKNNVRDWNKYRTKYIAKDGYIIIKATSFETADEAIANARAVLDIIEKKTAEVKARIEEKAILESKKDEMQQQIDDYCNELDGNNCEV